MYDIMENKVMKLLLVEDDVKECNIYKKIENERADIEFVAVTNSENNAVEYVKKYKPEGIILDLELNNGTGTGFNFLERISLLELEDKPKIVVTTNVCSTAVYEYLHEKGIDFIFYKKQKNYSRETVINTLLILKGYKENRLPEMSKEDINKENDIISDKINEELNLIGVSMHLQGRKYLYDAIDYLIKNDNSNQKITVVQYLVGKYKKSNSTISRAMQNAILHAWRVSSIEDLTTYYTARVNYETGVPTPTEFMYYYADKIKKLI